jgi:prepilin-type N-terminal cleavage/methylation domain-containing protein
MPTATAARNAAEHRERYSRHGMTLIEVILAMGIFAIVILWTLSTLMSAITTNRILTANVTANATILQQQEELQEIASSDIKSPAAAIIRHYASLAEIITIPPPDEDDEDEENNAPPDYGDNGILVGPNGQSVPKLHWDEDDRGLVYTFAIPGPADSIADDAPFNRGFGEMLIYLNEEKVPVNWSDLGDKDGVSAGAGTGYDINGDQTIKNALSADAKSDLENGDFDAFDDSVEPHRLPVDITVRYFTDASHSRLYFDTTRRSVFIGMATAWQD